MGGGWSVWSHGSLCGHRVGSLGGLPGLGEIHFRQGESGQIYILEEVLTSSISKILSIY